MRGLLNLIVTLVFSLLTTLSVAAVTLKHANVTAASLKQKLVSHQTYDKLIGTIVQGITQSDNKNLSAQLERFITAEVTPEYLQDKTETLIDDLDLWLTTPNAPSPILSFDDLKQQLIGKNARLVDELLKIESEYQELKPELETMAQANSEFNAQSTSSLPDIRLSQLLSQNTSINLAPPLTPLKWLVLLSTRYFLPLLALTLTCLVLSYAINRQHQPFKAMAKVLLVAIILNTLPALLIFLLPHYISTAVTASLPPFATSLTSLAVTPLLSSYQTIVISFLAAYLVVMLALFFTPTQPDSPIKPIARTKFIRKK